MYGPAQEMFCQPSRARNFSMFASKSEAVFWMIEKPTMYLWIFRKMTLASALCQEALSIQWRRATLEVEVIILAFWEIR